MDQLRREKEEERQLQDLQRLQEQASGKKASEKMDWMYAAPATGNGMNVNEMEDYLLGKKRVDKLLKGDEEKLLAQQEQQVITNQKANTARDTSNKIREDPLLAIKQQEQAAYDALINNPFKLREMRARAGIPDPDSKSSKRAAKDERKRDREERRRLKESKSYSNSRREYSPYDDRRRYDDYDNRYSKHSRHNYDDHKYTSSSRRDRDYSPDRYSSRHDRDYSPDRHSNRRDRDDRYSSRYDRNDKYSNRYDRDYKYLSKRDYYYDDHKTNYKLSSPGRYDNQSRSKEYRSHRPSPPSQSQKQQRDEREQEERSKKLAAMSSSAKDLQKERDLKHDLIARKDAEENEREAIARSKDAKVGGHNKFIADEQRKVYGGLEGGLGERMRRSGMASKSND